MKRKAKSLPSKKKQPYKSQAPAFIRIGYQDYTLKMQPYSLETTGEYGHTNRVNSVISVNQMGNQVEQVNTLIHECLHAIYHTQGIKTDVDTEELVVNSLANGLVQMIRDNPQLIEYILDQLGMLK